MKVSPHVRASLESETGVLLHVQRDRLYSLDRIGTEIWRLFASGLPPDAIATSIARDHRAPLSLVHGDVLKFLDRLEQQGLVIRAESDVHAHPAVADARMPSTVSTASTWRTAMPSARVLVARSVWRLLRVDFDLHLRGFNHVCQAVARHRTRAVACPDGIVAEICRAVDRACTVYPRQALCLPRSAAAACVLRDHGVAASLVIGARKHPFRAHAWVEVGGTVVNDKRGVKDYYDELDRF